MSHDLKVGHVLKGQFLAQVFGCESGYKCAIKAKASTYVGERGRGSAEVAGLYEGLENQTNMVETVVLRRDGENLQPGNRV